MQTELLLTFSPDNLSSKASGGKSLASAMLVPLSKEDTGGRMRIWVIYNPSNGKQTESDDTRPKEGGDEVKSDARMELVWDRKERERFPEMKELVSQAVLLTLHLFSNLLIFFQSSEFEVK